VSICFQIIRTVKFLCAISVAHYVVSPDWIDKSQKSNSLLGNYEYNHNYNKIVKCDWLSTALISALIGQFNRTVRVMPK